VTGGARRDLFLHVGGPLDRLEPQCKLVATVLFVAAVVSTPKEQVWAFGLHGTIVVTTALGARVPLLILTRRLTIELPFLVFAFLMPFLGGGDRVELVGLELSRPGLWGAWNVLAKATLGVAATVLLTATTTVPHLLAGLERLRMPSLLVAIMSFMVRYGEVVTSDMARMRVARISRGDRARWLWQGRAIAHSAGTLFIRSYERGERVFLAMQARGFTGTMPSHLAAATARSWFVTSVVPCTAAAISIAAWCSR
jgi:cobalt/nickel transport system permease protein